MSTTGQVYPSLGETVSESPWSDDTWVTPTNIYSDNAATANVTATSFDAGDQTFVLKATGFNFSSIPDDAVIKGVICRTNAWMAVAASIDLMQLLNTSKAKVGTNQATTPITLTTNTADVHTKGSSTDLWGNALTASWVKNSNFGVAIGMLAGGTGNNNVDVFCDYVTLEVYYDQSLTGTSAGQAGDSAALTATEKLAGTAAATSTASAITASLQSISATIAGTTSASASVGLTEFLSGTASGQSSASSLISVSEKLAGTIAAISTVMGEVSLLESLAGSCTAQSTASGDLSESGQQFSLTGSITAQCNLSGTIKSTERTIGSSDGISEASAVLSGRELISGQVSASSGINGAVLFSWLLIGSVPGQSAVSGNVASAQTLGGTIPAVSSLAAELTQISELIGTVTAQSGASGSLSEGAGDSLAGIISATSTLAGLLSVRIKSMPAYD